MDLLQMYTKCQKCKAPLQYSSLHCFKDLNESQIKNIAPWLDIIVLDNQEKNNIVLATFSIAFAS